MGWEGRRGGREGRREDVRRRMDGSSVLHAGIGGGGSDTTIPFLPVCLNISIPPSLHSGLPVSKGCPV